MLYLTLILTVCVYYVYNTWVNIHVYAFFALGCLLHGTPALLHMISVTKFVAWNQVFHVHHICICFIHNVYHMYIVCQSQTTKFTGARFDRLIPPLCSKAPQMDRGHKPLFLSADIHSAFPSGYMQVPF